MFELYQEVCEECSTLITKRYSTSFSMGIRLFAKELRKPIYGIYGFVRFADEIVDTFHDYNKGDLLQQFRQDTDKAIDLGISLNPVLQAFQKVVNDYNIDRELIHAFLDSMAMDLTDDMQYDKVLYEKYIYGSAEVVGLMCLKVFLKGNEEKYLKLKDSAKALGSAFQKINFLRDIKDDYYGKGRTYFPGVDVSLFSDNDKVVIEEDIKKDFDFGLSGILGLPSSAKFGVYLAYKFYYNLFQKIKKTSYNEILDKRIRINNGTKLYLLAKYSVKNTLNLI